MSEKGDSSQPPPSLSPPPKPPTLDIPDSPPFAGSDQKSLNVSITKDSPDEDEAESGGIPPINTRLIAAILDMLVASGISWLVAMILPDMLGRLAWVLAAGYLVTRDSLPFLKGQSIGKMAMKLKVEKQSGGNIIGDWQSAIVRNIALLVPFFAVVEAIVLFSRDGKPEKGLRLGDEWAKTRVVVAGAPVEKV